MSGAPESWEAGLLRSWRSILSEWTPGLSDREFDEIQGRYRVRFPPDLRACLAERVPVGLGFPDWRAGERRHRIWDGSIKTTALRDVLRAPLLGVLREIEEGAFWLNTLGPRAETSAARRKAAAEAAAGAPALVPVYLHRYIPCLPHEAGSPVISIVQTDAIYYGSDLIEYIAAEFRQVARNQSRPVRRIPFWSDIIERR